MFRRTLLFLFVAMFISLAAYVFAQDTQQHKMQQRPMVKEAVDRVKARVDELTKELSLTPKQQAEIKEILLNSKEEAKKILEEIKPKIKEIRVKAHDKINALLTEEQKKKFQEVRKKHEVPPKMEE